MYNDTMSLYKRGGVYWSRILHRGHLYRRSLRATKLTEARQLESQFRAQIGAMGIKRPPTINEFSTDFLNFLPRHVKPRTKSAYNVAWCEHILKYEPLANTPLNEIDSALVDRFANERLGTGLAVATVNHTLRVLSRALHLAVEWRIIPSAPKIHYLRGENRREYVISEADEKALARYDNDLLRDLIPFKIDTGLRIGELAALKWPDTTETTVHVREGKTKLARRTVPLTKRAAEILARRRKEAVADVPYVFTRWAGKHPISTESASHLFLEARKKAGLPDACVLHSCRHTFCTRLGKAGASPYELQRLAGHSNIQTSARYCHPDTEQLSRAIERMNK